VPYKRLGVVLQIAALLLATGYLLLTTIFDGWRAQNDVSETQLRVVVVVGLCITFLALLLVLAVTRTTENRSRLLMKLGLLTNLGIVVAIIFAGSLDWTSASSVDVASRVLAVTAIAPETTVASTTTVVKPAPVPTKRIRKVFVIGDSAIAGLRRLPSSQVALQGFDVTLDLESCRRLVHHNCKSREGHHVANALDTILDRTYGEADTLIVGVGYNDKSTTFANDFDLVVDAARSRGFSQVIWLTYRETSRYLLPGVDYTSDYASMNQILRGRIASGAYSDVVIADLWMYTTTVPEWFVRDGVHYKLNVAFGVADFLSRTIAALDGAPCPQPWTSGGSAETPCPRPESVVAARGQADLSGLYGI